MLLGSSSIGQQALAFAPQYAVQAPAGPPLCTLTVALLRADGTPVVGALVEARAVRPFINNCFVGDMTVQAETNGAGIASLALIAAGAGIFAWRVRAFDGEDLLLDREAETPPGVAVLREVSRVPRLQ